MKKRLIAYDVLRIAAALMVLCFHFDAAVPQYIDAPTYPSPFVTGLGTHLLGGNVAVCIFFMLSGALSAKDIERDSFDVVAYWRKRASRLFVPFFLSWFLVVFARYLFQRRPFMGIPKSRLLLTATGLDGYLTGFGVSCFGLVGEWFFGALVIVTAIWPVVRWALSRRYVPTLLALVVLELAAFGVCQAFIGDQGRAVMIAWRLPTTCLASYAAGAALLRFCGRLREGRPAVVRYGMVALLLLAGALFPYGTAWGNIGYQLAAAGFFCTATFLQADVGKLLEGGGYRTWPLPALEARGRPFEPHHVRLHVPARGDLRRPRPGGGGGGGPRCRARRHFSGARRDHRHDVPLRVPRVAA